MDPHEGDAMSTVAPPDVTPTTPTPEGRPVWPTLALVGLVGSLAALALLAGDTTSAWSIPAFALALYGLGRASEAVSRAARQPGASRTVRVLERVRRGLAG